MKIDRRSFLKYCIGSAAAMGLPMTVVGKLEQAMAAGGADLPKVIWLNAANCTGCTVSLSNLIGSDAPTDIADLLINTIDLMFHSTLMGAAGDSAVQQINDTVSQNDYILVVEGGIPTAFNGHTCILWSDQGYEVTALEAVQTLAPGALAVLSVGTCSSFGGIPGGNPNPTGIMSVNELIDSTAINIPGCPTHPDWIVWTIAHLLAGEVPNLDSQNRPTTLYGNLIHKRCPRKEEEEADYFGIPNQCLKELGCKGEKVRSDCPSRHWNNGTNWCIGAGSICIACTESGFPDQFSSFYKLEYEYDYYSKPPEDPDPYISYFRFKWAFLISHKSLVRTGGLGEPGDVITLYDNDGVRLGDTTVRPDGKWRFAYLLGSELSTPNTLEARTDERIAFKDVRTR